MDPQVVARGCIALHTACGGVVVCNSSVILLVMLLYCFQIFENNSWINDIKSSTSSSRGRREEK